MSSDNSPSDNAKQEKPETYVHQDTDFESPEPFPTRTDTVDTETNLSEYKKKNSKKVHFSVVSTMTVPNVSEVEEKIDTRSKDTPILKSGYQKRKGVYKHEDLQQTSWVSFTLEGNVLNILTTEGQLETEETKNNYGDRQFLNANVFITLKKETRHSLRKWTEYKLLQP